MLFGLSTMTTLVLIGVGLFVVFYLLPVILFVVDWIHRWFVSDPAANAPSATTKATAPGLANLDEWLEPIRRRYKVPALAAAFVRDGELRALGAVGVRVAGRTERVTHDDRFHLGSCTKAMTATVCARLVERGLLRWDSTVAELFPELAEKLHATNRIVTLEQLLAHRSGITEGVQFNLNQWPKIWELTGPLDELRKQLIVMLLADEAGTPPGKTYSYSNCGYAIAAALAERAAGRIWEELMREELFVPLGMTSAGYGPPGTLGTVDQPWGHQLKFWSRKWVPMPPEENSDNPPVTGPAGRVHATMADWAKFVAYHLTGPGGDGSFLKPDTFRILHRPPFGGDYALGWSVMERDWAGGKALTHGGSNTMWHCVVWIAPQKNVAVLAASNLGTNSGFAACDAAVSDLIHRAESL